MFDIVVTAAPGTQFAPRIANTLRGARMRVIRCEVGPNKPPPDALRVDAAVACAASSPDMLDIARSVRAALDGPPPIVGVTAGPPISTGELEQSFPDDVPDATLVTHVQRAAAQAERRRSKVILRGDLDDVGLDNLLASLTARNKSCFIRVRSPSRRAEITLEGGRPIHVRADGIDTSRDKVSAINAIAAFREATFEVIAVDDPPPSRPLRDSSRPPTFGQGDATHVALAAAVVNACSSYARAWIEPTRATRLLESARVQAMARHPSLDAFSISNDGLVSVNQVDRAMAAVPQAIADWIVRFFDGAASVNPARFRRTRLREVLGGLMRLVERVGWASVLCDADER